MLWQALILYDPGLWLGSSSVCALYNKIICSITPQETYVMVKAIIDKGSQNEGNSSVRAFRWFLGLIRLTRTLETALNRPQSEVLVVPQPLSYAGCIRLRPSEACFGVRGNSFKVCSSDSKGLGFRRVQGENPGMHAWGYGFSPLL